MPGLLVVGLQWGDEGKGKILDALSSTADVVVRYQGGSNAGHTVYHGEKKFVFHLLPTGVLADGVTNVVGNGVALDVVQLLREIDELAASGIDVTPRLRIAERAHIVLPHHKALDAAREDIRPPSGVFRGIGETDDAPMSQPIGTTRRGIGPCYADKAARLGIRVVDALDPDRLEARLHPVLKEANALLAGVYGAQRVELDETMAEIGPAIDRIRDLVCDGGGLIRSRLADGKRVLFEGAQGALLDIDHGTYPFVTSSSSTALGAAVGSGVPARAVDHIVGVAKAYTTRVGAGPFPSEIHGPEGVALREAGAEFGATTGRPRRCGWFDAVAMRYAVELSGVDSVCLTKLDVLAGRETIPIVTAYQIGDRRIESFPADVSDLEAAKPVTTDAPGPATPFLDARERSAVPEGAFAYVGAVEKAIGRPVSMLSTGPDRDALIRLTGDLWGESTGSGPTA